MALPPAASSEPCSFIPSRPKPSREELPCDAWLRGPPPSAPGLPLSGAATIAASTNATQAPPLAPLPHTYGNAPWHRLVATSGAATLASKPPTPPPPMQLRTRSGSMPASSSQSSSPLFFLSCGALKQASVRQRARIRATWGGRVHLLSHLPHGHEDAGENYGRDWCARGRRGGKADKS